MINKIIDSLLLYPFSLHPPVQMKEIPHSWLNLVQVGSLQRRPQQSFYFPLGPHEIYFCIIFGA